MTFSDRGVTGVCKDKFLYAKSSSRVTDYNGYSIFVETKKHRKSVEKYAFARISKATIVFYFLQYVYKTTKTNEKGALCEMADRNCRKYTEDPDKLICMT